MSFLSNFTATLFSPTGAMLVGGAAIIIAIMWWDKILAGIKKMGSRTSTTPPITTDKPGPLDEDALDLIAFRRLQARYTRLGCKEGIAAMETAGQHFLHGTGGP